MPLDENMFIHGIHSQHTPLLRAMSYEMGSGVHTFLQSGRVVRQCIISLHRSSDVVLIDLLVVLFIR